MQPFPAWLARVPVAQTPARDALDSLTVQAALNSAFWAKWSTLTQGTALLVTLTLGVVAWRSLRATQAQVKAAQEQVKAALEQSQVQFAQHQTELERQAISRQLAADDFALWLHSRLARDAAPEWDAGWSGATNTFRASALLASFKSEVGGGDLFILDIEGRRRLAPLQDVRCTRAWARTIAAARGVQKLMPPSLVDIPEMTGALEELRPAARGLWAAVNAARSVEHSDLYAGGALLTTGDMHLQALRAREP